VSLCTIARGVEGGSGKAGEKQAGSSLPTGPNEKRANQGQAGNWRRGALTLLWPSARGGSAASMLCC